MMTSAELVALAERVEALTGPCRETDVAIGLTGKFYVAQPRYPGAKPMIGYVDDDGGRVEPGNGGADSLVPAYTASLDAAMTLVPSEWCVRINQTSDGERADNTSVEGLPDWAVAMIPHALTGYANRNKAWGGWLYGNAATPALALTAASLRALAAKEPA